MSEHKTTFERLAREKRELDEKQLNLNNEIEQYSTQVCELFVAGMSKADTIKELTEARIFNRRFMNWTEGQLFNYEHVISSEMLQELHESIRTYIRFEINE